MNDEASGTATLALFDPSGTSHSGNALRGLARAASAAEVGTTLYAHPSISPRPVYTATRWVEVDGSPDLFDGARRRTHRRQLLESMRDFGSGPGRIFCDMGLDRTVVSRGPRIEASPDSVFICHRIAALDRVPARWRRRIRRPRAGNRAVLRELGAAGARFVVHTDAVGQRISEFVPADQVVQLGWAVVARDEATLSPTWTPAVRDRMVLLAGSLRNEKGFIPFLQAAPSVPGYDRLVVPGRIPKAYRDLLPTDEPRLQLLDRWLEEVEYRRIFTEAALVVLPYEAAYSDRGTTSSVLLEAMACGRPLLLTAAIAHLLPPGYEGAVIVASTEPECMAEGLQRALDELETLERAAMDSGRRHIATNHTFESYLDGVLGGKGRR